MDGTDRKYLLGGALAAGLVVVVLGLLLPVTVPSSHLHYMTSYVGEPPRPSWSTETTIDDGLSFWVYDGTVTASCAGVLRRDQSDQITRTPSYDDLGFFTTNPCTAARDKRRTLMIGAVGGIVILTLAAVVVLQRRRRSAPSEPVGG